MKRLVQSKYKTDESTFAPLLNIIFYDDLENFQLYRIKVKLTAEFMQELNAMQNITAEKSDELLNFFLISKQGASTLISKEKVDISDIDIDKIKDDYKKGREMSHESYYNDLLNNIKLLRREKNLHDLGL